MSSSGSDVTIVALHGLGGAAGSFDVLTHHLEGERIVALDLPGFGTLRDAPGGGDITAMTESVIDRLSAGNLILLGHSLGGKVAVATAAQLPATHHSPESHHGPQIHGLVLLAPSPLTPEPMSEDKRRTMIATARAGLDERAAESFFDDGPARFIQDPTLRTAIAAFITNSPDAWVTWFESGSRVDLTASLDLPLAVPALIISGDEDEDLGASAQPHLQARILSHTHFLNLANTGHQVALQRPWETAQAIRAFLRTLTADAHFRSSHGPQDRE